MKLTWKDGKILACTELNSLPPCWENQSKTHHSCLLHTLKGSDVTSKPWACSSKPTIGGASWESKPSELYATGRRGRKLPLADYWALYQQCAEVISWWEKKTLNVKSKLSWENFNLVCSKNPIFHQEISDDGSLAADLELEGSCQIHFMHAKAKAEVAAGECLGLACLILSLLVSLTVLSWRCWAPQISASISQGWMTN